MQTALAQDPGSVLSNHVPGLTPSCHSSLRHLVLLAPSGTHTPLHMPPPHAYTQLKINLKGKEQLSFLVSFISIATFPLHGKVLTTLSNFCSSETVPGVGYYSGKH